MSIEIDCHGESHVGMRRHANEDQFLIADLNKSMRVHQTSLGLNHQTRLFGGSQGKLLLVADGLGGHESGERASTLAVDGVTNYVLNAMDWVFQLDEHSEANFETDLKKALRHSQEALQNEADAIPQRRGMATTLTMAYIDWPNFYVVHVGDTRCYHIRSNKIECLTTDHTLGELTRTANRMSNLAKGQVSKASDESQGSSRMDNTLYNVIGGSDPGLDPQVQQSELEVGDALLLCSDGLTRYVSDDELLEAIQADDQSAAEICHNLIEKANQRGGKDNITVVLAKFSENQPQQVDHAQADQDQTESLLDDTAKHVPSKVS
ncbi:MAG: protein phosphatase 2C domain-containing protein [Planctomycetota bacterium]